MRDLLFVSHRIPYPLNKGEKIRAYNLLRHLARDWRIHLGCLIDDPADAAHLPLLREICAEAEGFAIDKRWQKLHALARFRPGRPLMLDYYRHPGLREWVAARLGMADVHYIYSAAMAPYVLDAGPRGQAARVLDMQDIDSEKWATYAKTARLPMRAVWAREARTLLAYERHAAMACDVTFFVSEPETIRFAELAPEAADRVTWVENGVDLDGFSPARAFESPYAVPGADPGPRLIFTGNMDYWPNADAVIWFATEILPLLRRRAVPPGFFIVGANPGPEVRRLADLPGVTVTGRVADVRPWLAHADVSVGPLRIARGIQNKVLEAMAMGRPVVASPGAYEGVRAVAGRDLLVADGAGPMAAAIGAVLDGVHPGLGAAGRAAVEAGYAWSATLARLDAALARVAPPAALR